MGKVQVDPELLHQAADKVQHVSDRISQTLNTLQSSADGKGSPWGDDVYGYKFAEGDNNDGYLAAQSSLHEITSGLVGHSQSHAEGVHTSATDLTTVDDQNSDGFQ
ncbi:WXG100 family type VII secretion target [Nocardia alni]|uniref:WXG100 family type VII secretion target n=1 Tax=Nocardia alni TaxID=2815723 RepID=UPI001C2247F5|nr:hypothetical protein [Nocardia alni]